MIIDTHMHLFPDKLCPQTIEKLAVTNPKKHLTPYGDGSVGCAEKNMKKWGVDLSVLLPIATNPRQQKSVNNFAKEIQDNYSNFITFGTIHPDAEDYEAELDRIVEMGFYGIKLHPDYQGFFVDEKRIFPLYQAISERNLPLVFHTGYDPVSPSCLHSPAERVVEVAKAFPDLQIIAAHTGGLAFVDGPKDIYMNLDNVHFDTAIASYTFKPKDYRKLIDLYTADKFMFATDNPWGNGQKDIDFMKAVGLNSDEWETIMHKNAETLLSIC
ncbi:MAG: amidohydrolase family protein [Eubacterium sp.]